MAKSENQKLKLLYLAKILMDETDIEHPLSTKELIDKLSSLDIKVERKTIYSDVECLREFGMDIEFLPERSRGGYYLASREFELAELKILVDMVQSSRFLTKKKSRELIHKLETLASRHDAAQLQRTVYVGNRAKAENETVYYGVDMIHRAIQDNKGITFQYAEYTASKELKLKKDGSRYQVSPYYLTWNNENYYLVGVDESIGAIRHYRVDRMKQIDISSKERGHRELFDNFDIAEYTNAAFGMFGGEKTSVVLECQNSLVSVVLDRFGKEVSVHPKDKDYFTVKVNVVTSNQFYGWLSGLSGQVRIISPQDKKEEYLAYLQNILAQYKE